MVEFLARGFGGGAGGDREVSEAWWARHIDAALDRMNPGRARIRHHDAGGAQDRQAAHNAEAGIERPGGEPLAVRDPDFDFDIAPPPFPGTAGVPPALFFLAERRSGRDARGPSGNFRDGVANHPAGHWIDGRLAWWNRKARPGDNADAGAGAECDAAAGRGSADRREHERTVRDVTVVAGVLDDARSGGARILACHRQPEHPPFPRPPRNPSRT